ncbi:MAG: YceI family protein [Streptosporangiaceae bacterium]|nr:YceI family protein [Streptosporangiaceae bacterium]
MTIGTLPATGIYTLDPERTTIRCDCKALMGLLTVHGTFRLNAGQVRISEDLAECSVQASIAAGSYASGNGTRDADVLSAKLLDAESYPEITFTGTGARPGDEGAGWAVTGSVTAHGTTRPVEVRVTEVWLEDSTARFRATATLDRLSFGITKMKLRVGQTVDLAIDAAGIPA